ncbi:carbohydrate ABC transporter permease [Paenibacillus yanchengensis]|uniref:Carbohydrate ABC transporter permease n=1 Tax=Paenibacillus yanchengensis TaxID=2035833 RepID=A0ABW4YR65_9BACL
MRNVKSGLLFDLLNYILLNLLFIVTLYPFYYIFIYSISDPTLAQKGIALLPAGFSLDAYKSVFMLKGMKDAALITVLRTVIGTTLTIICCSFFAYIITKPELPFRRIIYRFLLVTMYFNAGFIPWYLTMKSLHLNNSFLLYILPYAVSAFYVMLIKTFMEQLPPSLEESANIDGAGYVTVFIRIIFPLSKPIIATITVFAAVNQWNTWIDNFFLVENPKLQTLQLILYNYLNQANNLATKSTMELTRGVNVNVMTPASIRMTITMVVTLPIILVYPFMQRYFVKGIMLGAVKG